MNKILATFLLIPAFINSNSFADKLSDSSSENKIDYSLSVKMPEESIKLNTKELNIPFSYYLSDQSIVGKKYNAEIRVTFNLLNSNCYAFKVFRPEFNKSINSFTKTVKCDIPRPGIYMGYSMICVKGSAVGSSAVDLCKTSLGNITVK